MSRGPGALQRRTLETLALYDRVGGSLGWKWPKRRYDLADRQVIDAWERNPSVPLWMLRRDLQCSADRLSRALHGLHAMGFVSLYARDLDGIAYCFPKTKFARITDAGIKWLDSQRAGKSAFAEVGAYPADGGVPCR